MNMSFLRQLVESQAHTKLASLVHGKVFFDLPLEQHHCVVFNQYTDSYSWLSGRIWICYCSTMRNPCSWESTRNDPSFLRKPHFTPGSRVAVTFSKGVPRVTRNFEWHGSFAIWAAARSIFHARASAWMHACQPLQGSSLVFYHLFATSFTISPLVFGLLRSQKDGHIHHCWHTNLVPAAATWSHSLGARSTTGSEQTSPTLARKPALRQQSGDFFVTVRMAMSLSQYYHYHYINIIDDS